ncbi:uncharacterized protein B4U80_03761 [Leptotrombidium deliense]|uniref:Natterin-3-like protein n=1 Tax=Leptotrombidium deliense TaxID=299467 RepID=A0A443S0D7_9ACAR|nr:uncharacterized protein B4U80_03761 [Leptotrombidium deliense]
MQLNLQTAQCSAYWHWIDAGNGNIPDKAVRGGEDVNGESLFVGRVVHEGDTLPGKIVPSQGVCYVSHAGTEHAHKSYQVLVSDYELKWKQAEHGNVEKRAIMAGCTVDGQPLFIGRTYHDGSLVIGKVLPSQKTLYFPFAGNEHTADKYEVLRHKKHM